MPVSEICNREVVYAQRDNTTLDDMPELLAEEMSTLAKLVKHQHKKETINRR
jgi:hypothetical protein